MNKFKEWLYDNLAAGVIVSLCLFAAGLSIHPQPVNAQTYNRLGRNFNCVVTTSTATTVQAVGGDCVAPDSQSSLYITDINFGSSAASGTAADSMPTLKAISGNTCTSATTVIWLAQNAATTSIVHNQSVPIKVGAGNALCWIMTTAGTKTIVIDGYIGPG